MVMLKVFKNYIDLMSNVNTVNTVKFYRNKNIYDTIVNKIISVFILCGWMRSTIAMLGFSKRLKNEVLFIGYGQRITQLYYIERLIIIMFM